MADFLSITAVMRAPQSLADEAWLGIRQTATVGEPGKVAAGGKPVCCYAARGICLYGDTCDFLHDVSLIPVVGCHYKSACYHGHATQRSADLTQQSQEAHARIRKTLESATPCAYLECRGVNFEGTDLLWAEVATALSGESLSLGDGDLDPVTRKQLEAAGRYMSVKAETADEWLCLPGAALLDRLLASQAYLSMLHWEWIGDEFQEARWLCTQITKALLVLAPQAGQPEAWKKCITDTTQAMTDLQGSISSVLEAKTLGLDATALVRRCMECLAACLGQLDTMFRASPPSILAAQRTRADDCLDIDVADQLPELLRSCDRLALLLSSIAARSLDGDVVGVAGTATTAGSCSCLLDLVKESARREEFVLVHHVTVDLALDK